MIRNSICPTFRQAGSYVIWVMVLLPVLIGSLALSFDAGIAMMDHQRARTAADAAALAGAFAVKRDLPNLRSADATVKALAVARVQSAARETATANGFTHGVDDVQVSVNYPPTEQQSVYYAVNLADTEDIKEQKEIYVGVTITRPIRTEFAHFILPQSKLDEFSIRASAVGRAGTTGFSNKCPGLYMYGGSINNKVLDLNQGSDFEVVDGGIFINLCEGCTGTALYGSSGATMTADWIEKSVNAGQTGSVTYECTYFPVGTPCPMPTSDVRYEPEPPPPATCVTSNKKGCVRENKLKWGCSKDDCLLANASQHQTKCGAGTNISILRAGDYCEGLTIYNSGTLASPLILKPSASTNRFNLAGSNLTVMGSYIRAETDAAYPDYDGVTIYSSYDADNPPPAPGTGRLEIGATNTKDSRSTVEGKLRIYFEAIWLTNHSTDTPPSKLSIQGFDESGCGKLPDTHTVVVQ